MSLVPVGGSHRHIVAGGTSPIILACIALLVFSARASAAETIYWDNYDKEASISFANIDGSGGGSLHVAGGGISNPEGMAYDSVTNRLFVANHGGTSEGQISVVNLDGSGASVFSAPGAPMEEPEGVTIDPVTRTIYWINDTSAGETISWARLDGSTGGVLNTTAATLDFAYRIALDPIGGRVYWGNNNPPRGISYANLDNSGGGDLNITGATPPDAISGVAVDPIGGRVYWADNTPTEEGISFANLDGSGGDDVNIAGATIKYPFGLAFDPSLGRIYWPNSQEDVRVNTIGFADLTGGVGGITPQTAPVNNVQDPVILKSPTGTGAPTLARGAKLRSELTCSSGSWAADFPGSFVYQAPGSIAYQWLRNGSPIGGAMAAKFEAKSPGSYTCTATATNQVGSASQTSAAVGVKAAKIKLTTKRKAKAKPGDLVTFKVKAVNQGDLMPKRAKVCVKLTKAARADLKVRRCKKLGQLNGRARKTVKIKVKVKPGADGTDKLTFRVRGSAGKAARSKIVIG